MCRIELATNTITAESRIGIHNALIGTIVPPKRSIHRMSLCGTRRSLLLSRRTSQILLEMEESRRKVYCGDSRPRLSAELSEASPDVHAPKAGTLHAEAGSNILAILSLDETPYKTMLLPNPVPSALRNLTRDGWLL